ncbi:MAG: nuclear transport factor 2 family protein [Porticoccaceae bacterium]|nr:nuclear transport factor 2 family protein [Porticoccaceae bacterium]|tara:strand:+ start:12670 stop:13083 length:414 start_codon:yes stop_codon:yes gene_type:complete
MPFSGSIEDRLAIRELLDIYADAVNQRDTALWASTWAEDASWKLPVIPGMENVCGKENIVTAWQTGMSMFPFIFMAFTVGGIQVDGNTATVRSYAAEVGTTSEGEEIRPRGQYDDQLIKVDGQWLFKERIFHSMYGE